MGLEFKPYKARTKEVNACRITEENKHEVYTKLTSSYTKDNYWYDGTFGKLYKNEKEVPDGDYLVVDDTLTYTESDGTFRDSYCPLYVSEEDQRIWHAMSTVTRRKYDTAEEAIAHTKELLNKTNK